MKKFDKEEFIRKYLSKVHEIEKIFESDKTLHQEEIEFYSDYNNAIVDVLQRIHPKYLYSQFHE